MVAHSEAAPPLEARAAAAQAVRSQVRLAQQPKVAQVVTVPQLLAVAAVERLQLEVQHLVLMAAMVEQESRHLSRELRLVVRAVAAVQVHWAARQARLVLVAVQAQQVTTVPTVLLEPQIRAVAVVATQAAAAGRAATAVQAS
jgi:hypothetical protein